MISYYCPTELNTNGYTQLFGLWKKKTKMWNDSEKVKVGITIKKKKRFRRRKSKRNVWNVSATIARSSHHLMIQPRKRKHRQTNTHSEESGDPYLYPEGSRKGSRGP